MRQVRLIVIIVLTFSLSCTFNKSITEEDNLLAVKTIFSDYEKYNYAWDYADFPGFIINRRLCISDSLTPYVFLHAEYQYYLSSGKNGNKTITGVDNQLNIDFERLIPMLKDTVYLPKEILIDDMPTNTVVGFNRDNLRSYNFSPLIPTNRKYTYIMLMEIFKERDDYYYFFSLTKKKNKFMVKLLDKNDFIYPLPPRLSGEVDLLNLAYETYITQNSK